MGDYDDPGPLPQRWLHCPRKSEGLLVDKFIAFKTPLSRKFDDKLPLANRFPPKMLFDSLKSYKVKLGLWINLTYTDRFYDKAEVEQMDCKYIKLQCRGHGETPTLDQTKMFVSIVAQFMRKNPLEKIGVHCTHGFNRTGFLLVAYMIEEMNCGLEFALNEFAKIRPPGIYKQDYINELFTRYDDISYALVAPMLPNWHTGCDDNNEGEPSSSGAATQRKAKRRRNVGNKSTILQPEIPTVFLFTTEPRVNEIEVLIQKMCQCKNLKFPGSQPVSMTVQNLEKLGEKPYRVSWKADGTRYLMLIDGSDEVYLFDRDNCAFHVENMRFPKNNNFEEHVSKTLLDGEMVIDKVGDQIFPRYLVYDIISLNDEIVGSLPFFPDRMNLIQQEIINPRHQAIKEGLIDRSVEPFSVRLKTFYDLREAASLLSEKFTKTLQHEPDGLIFQPSHDPYIPGQCDDVLKWKPMSMNSVDFKLKIEMQSGEGMLRQKIGLLYVGQLDHNFDRMKYTKALKDLDGKIIECKYENNQWVFMRERTDKSFPNSYNTAKAVVESIKNPVTEEMLLYYIDKNRYIDDWVMWDFKHIYLVTDSRKASDILKLILHMTELRNTGHPGCQPVPLTNDNLFKLGEKKYRVTWKADGIRFLMLIDGPNEVYLLDKDNRVYQVKNLQFPKKHSPKNHLKRTLLDGELVIDNEQGRGVPRFFIFDIIIFEGKTVRKLPFVPDRSSLIEMEIIAPRHQAMIERRIDKLTEPFSVRIQQYHNIMNVRDLLSSDFRRQLGHETSHFIFQPCNEPYITGISEEVLKWKPPHMSSASFKFKIVSEKGMANNRIGELFVKQLDIPFATIPITDEVKRLHNRIIECKYETTEWIFITHRHDKTSPSDYETATAVVEMTEDPVSEHTVMDFIHNHRYIEDSERMPPPPKRMKM